MVYNEGMDKFSALADPTRRKIIELLAQWGQLSASEIAGEFTISAPAISQHLKILQEAGLVHVERQAQRRIYRVDTQVMSEVEGWARRMREMWDRRFDALEKIVLEERRKE
jgi:DNA-binding transcriptional ArsR family regulator